MRRCRSRLPGGCFPYWRRSAFPLLCVRPRCGENHVNSSSEGCVFCCYFPCYAVSLSVTLTSTYYSSGPLKVEARGLQGQSRARSAPQHVFFYVWRFFQEKIKPGRRKGQPRPNRPATGRKFVVAWRSYVCVDAKLERGLFNREQCSQLSIPSWTKLFISVRKIWASGSSRVATCSRRVKQ